MNKEELELQLQDVAKNLPEKVREEFLEINRKMSFLTEKLKSEDITASDVTKYNEQIITLQNEASQLLGLAPVDSVCTKRRKTSLPMHKKALGILSLIGLGIVLVLILLGSA